MQPTAPTRTTDLREAVTHTYRPPIIPERVEHSHQRRYGADVHEAHGWESTIHETNRVLLVRIAYEAAAQIKLDIPHCTATVLLDADQMRALARRLLDAAHDIDQEESDLIAAAEAAA